MQNIIESINDKSIAHKRVKNKVRLNMILSIELKLRINLMLNIEKLQYKKCILDKEIDTEYENRS